MDLLSEYLNTLNESVELNEGISDIANKLFLFLGFGMPKDPKIQTLNKSHQLCMNICRKAFPQEVTRTTNRGASTISKYDPYNWNDKVARQDKEETSETIKEHPEYGKCLLRCKLEYLKQILKVLKQKGKKVCIKNRNVNLCEKWVDKFLPIFEKEIKGIEIVLGKTNTKRGNAALVKDLLKIV